HLVFFNTSVGNEVEKFAKRYSKNSFSSKEVRDRVAVLAKEVERIRMFMLDGLRYINDVNSLFVITIKEINTCRSANEDRKAKGEASNWRDQRTASYTQRS